MNIGLLECDNVVGRFPGIEGGYREMFASLLSPHLPGLKFSFFESWKGELPSGLGACDAYLATGSQYSVYEDRDWIAGMSQFIRDLGEAGKPFVGICFGHQMLAQSLGGEVTRAPQGWGVGVHEVEVVKSEPWMEPPQPRVQIHHMHADQVQRLPPGSVLLGRSAHCPIGMFRIGKMLGIEGHPEFTAAFNEALIRARAERIGVERTQAGLESLARLTDGGVIGRWIAQFCRAGMA